MNVVIASRPNLSELLNLLYLCMYIVSTYVKSKSFYHKYMCLYILHIYMCVSYNLNGRHIWSLLNNVMCVIITFVLISFPLICIHYVTFPVRTQTTRQNIHLKRKLDNKLNCMNTCRYAIPVQSGAETFCRCAVLVLICRQVPRLIFNTLTNSFCCSYLVTHV